MLVAPTKFFHELSPPYCSLQIVTKYRYKYNNYVTVSTIVQPVSGDLSKIYKTEDVQTTALNKVSLNIKPGEFVGKAKNANVPRFHTRFKPYIGGKAESTTLPRIITKEDINKNYDKIINDIEFLLRKN